MQNVRWVWNLVYYKRSFLINLHKNIIEMTKRDFFKIIIKLFALYFLLLVVFNFIPSNLRYAIIEFEPIVIISIIISTLVMGLLFIFLLRKSDTVIDVLKLDKGFDTDQIELGNFNSFQVVKLALIFIGGFLFLDYIPQFLRYSFLAFKKEVSINGPGILEGYGYGDQMDYFQWTVSGMNLILAYLILTNYPKIANWMTREN